MLQKKLYESISGKDKENENNENIIPISRVFKEKYLYKKYFFNALLIKSNGHEMLPRINITKIENKQQDRSKKILCTIMLKYLYDYFKDNNILILNKKQEKLSVQKHFENLKNNNENNKYSQISKDFLSGLTEINVNFNDENDKTKFIDKMLKLVKNGHPNTDTVQNWLKTLFTNSLKLKENSFDVEVEPKNDQ